MKRENIIEILSNKVGVVTFTKKDGNDRVMRCTLLESMIPSDKAPKGTGSVNDAVVPVFDLDLGEWRSFRIDSVKEVVAQ
jgi:hypothetical protein